MAEQLAGHWVTQETKGGQVKHERERGLESWRYHCGNRMIWWGFTCCGSDKMQLTTPSACENTASLNSGERKGAKAQKTAEYAHGMRVKTSENQPQRMGCTL